MPKVVPIKDGYTPTQLRHLAATSKDANQSRRLLSIAAALDGMSRAEAAKIGGMDRQTLRDWSIASTSAVSKGSRMAGAGTSRGGCPKLSRRSSWRSSRRARIASWTASCVGAGLIYSASSLSASGRVSRADDRQALEAFRLLARQWPPEAPEARWRDHRGFQKNFPRILAAHLGGIVRHRPVEIWFQDEARIGQKNGRVRQWE